MNGGSHANALNRAIQVCPGGDVIACEYLSFQAVRPLYMKRLSILLLLLTTLAGCERLGIPDPAKEAEQKEAEGKAIGSACRHSGRALEDCFTLNPMASKAAVFAGWREMNDYMAENKIEAVKPELPPPTQLPSKRKLEKPDPAASEPNAEEEPVEPQKATTKKRTPKTSAAH